MIAPKVKSVETPFWKLALLTTISNCTFTAIAARFKEKTIKMSVCAGGVYESMLLEDHGVRLIDRHLEWLRVSGVGQELIADVKEAILGSCLSTSEKVKLRVEVCDDSVNVHHMPPDPFVCC